MSMGQKEKKLRAGGMMKLWPDMLGQACGSYIVTENKGALSEVVGKC